MGGDLEGRVFLNPAVFDGFRLRSVESVLVHSDGSIDLSPPAAFNSNLGLKNYYSKLKKKLSSKKIIRSIKLGSGNIHFYSVLKYYNLLINELKKDQFFLLKKPPRFKKGRLPFA